MGGDSGIQCPGLEVGQVKWRFRAEPGLLRKLIERLQHALGWVRRFLGPAGSNGIRLGENGAKMGLVGGKWGGTCWTDGGYRRQDESKKRQRLRMEGWARSLLRSRGACARMQSLGGQSQMGVARKSCRADSGWAQTTRAE